MKTWKCGIVGAGLIADFHARALSELPNTKLVAVTDVIEAKARAFAQKFDCNAYTCHEKMLKESGIDIITIATPSGLHAEPVIAAAKYGKHAICEKPLEITLERIDDMIEAHKRAGTYLGCIFQNRFTDAMVPLRKAITQGRFGTITYAGVYVPWWRTDDYYKNSWHGKWKLDGGGALMNQSIHMIDMLCDLLPPITSVKAFAGSLGHDIETEDTAVAILRFANNALGIVYGTSASFPGQLKRFEITGTKGTVVYLEDSFTVWQFADETLEDEQIRKGFDKVKGLGGAADPAKITHEHHKRNFTAFVNAIEHGTSFALDGNEGRKAVSLILEIYKSAGIKC